MKYTAVNYTAVQRSVVNYTAVQYTVVNYIAVNYTVLSSARQTIITVLMTPGNRNVAFNFKLLLSVFCCSDQNVIVTPIVISNLEEGTSCSCLELFFSFFVYFNPLPNL